MSNKKSIFRGPNAQHFTVVHRSQRDPLINDPEAPERVLAPIYRPNEFKKGKSRAELQQALPRSTIDAIRANEGEASLYDIYFDDTEYDYLKHLKAIGDAPDGVFVPTPSSSKQSNRPDAVQFKDDDLALPADVLPSKEQTSYSDYLGIPDKPWGLQPDMDPSLREVLEALEDDAYVDEEDEGDFLNDIINDDSAPPPQPEDYRESYDSDDDYASDEMDGSEDEDTLAELTAASLKRIPRQSARPASASVISGMSSASMSRNDGLSTLDDRFEKIESMYEHEDSDSSTDSEDFDPSSQREDFDELMDEFLDHFEVLGGKMRPVMEGSTPAGKLETMRRELGKLDLDALPKRRRVKEERVDMEIREQKPQWDCESILSTYSNLENHPRMIKVRDAMLSKKTPVNQISIDPKTGFPVVNNQKSRRRMPAQPESESDEEGSDTEMEDEVKKETVKRARGETAEEKRARKAGVKAERQARRQAKKTNKTVFGTERKSQQTKISKMLQNGGAADVRNSQGIQTMSLS